jgi:hypothetical protein
MLPTREDPQAEPFRSPSELEPVSAALARLPLHEAAVNELRSAICTYVRTQKARGAPPEIVLGRVKGLVQTLPLSRWGSSYALEIHRELMAVVVAWCISAYYGEEQARSRE